MALDDDARRHAIRNVLLGTLALNVLVAAAKLAYGHWTSTLGLVADGYHSSLDGTSNVVGLIGVTLGAALPDKEHPYGHRKFEVLSAMVISLFIFASAWTVLHEAWLRLGPPAAGSVPRVDAGSFLVSLGTLGINVFVARFERRRGAELSSPFLIADAAHTASDVVVTIGVILGLAATRFIHPVADVVLALIVGAFLVKTGYGLLVSGAHVVSDAAVFPVEAVERAARAVDGVRGCARIRTRGHEEHAFLDMVVLVDPDRTVASAHEVADRVEEELQRTFPGLQDIVIHIEPASATAVAGGGGVG